jgi:ribonuclease HI
LRISNYIQNNVANWENDKENINMATKKQKYYVVWQGKRPGIYDNWAEAEEHIKGVEGAKYKSYETENEAIKAFSEKAEKHIYNKTNPSSKTISKNTAGQPNPNSIAVDAACAGNPGVLEYQGVETISKKLIFKMGPFPEGTVNLGEFLALVHGIALLKKNNSDVPIYSDSRTAIAWVRNKKIKTNLERTAKNSALFELVDRAITWLNTNTYTNKILKWETENWGENPADYGRK